MRREIDLGAAVRQAFKGRPVDLRLTRKLRGGLAGAMFERKGRCLGRGATLR